MGGVREKKAEWSASDFAFFSLKMWQERRISFLKIFTGKKRKVQKVQQEIVGILSELNLEKKNNNKEALNVVSLEHRLLPARISHAED